MKKQNRRGKEENLVTSSRRCISTLHLTSTMHFTVAEDEKIIDTKMEETSHDHHALHRHLYHHGCTCTCGAPCNDPSRCYDTTTLNRENFNF